MNTYTHTHTPSRLLPWSNPLICLVVKHVEGKQGCSSAGRLCSPRPLIFGECPEFLMNGDKSWLPVLGSLSLCCRLQSPTYSLWWYIRTHTHIHFSMCVLCVCVCVCVSSCSDTHEQRLDSKREMHCKRNRKFLFGLSARACSAIAS